MKNILANQCELLGYCADDKNCKNQNIYDGLLSERLKKETQTYLYFFSSIQYSQKNSEF